MELCPPCSLAVFNRSAFGSPFWSVFFSFFFGGGGGFLW